MQTGATTPNIVGHIRSCCVCVGSGVQTDTATPSIGGPTMLGVVVSVLVVVCKRVQQLPTLLDIFGVVVFVLVVVCKRIQQHPALVAQQCWELLCPCW